MREPLVFRPWTGTMVGVTGVGPVTSSLSGTRSNQLSYTPVSFPRGAEGEVRQRKFVRGVRLNFWEARPASRACHVSSGRPLRAFATN